MSQYLLFIATIAGMLSIVPLTIWAATGRLCDAWVAFKEYMICMGIITGLGLVVALGAIIDSVT